MYLSTLIVPHSPSLYLHIHCLKNRYPKHNLHIPPPDHVRRCSLSIAPQLQGTLIISLSAHYAIGLPTSSIYLISRIECAGARPTTTSIDRSSASDLHSSTFKLQYRLYDLSISSRPSSEGRFWHRCVLRRSTDVLEASQRSVVAQRQRRNGTPRRHRQILLFQ